MGKIRSGGIKERMRKLQRRDRKVHEVACDGIDEEEPAPFSP